MLYAGRSVSAKSCLDASRPRAMSFRAGAVRDNLTDMKSPWLLLATAGALLASSAYVAEIAEWRTRHETGLKSPNGWLSVAGLFWLHDGPNAVGSDPQSDVVLPESAPRRAGVLTFRAGKVSFEPADRNFDGKRGVLRPDA